MAKNELAIPNNSLIKSATVDVLSSRFRGAPENWELLPVSDLKSAVVAVDGCLEPMQDTEADIIAADLVGAYPNAKPANPVSYMAAISDAFYDYPPEIGKRAADTIRKNNKFAPTQADVVEACEKLKGEILTLRQRALMMLSEHQRRSIEAERDKQLAENRERHKRLYGDKTMLEVLQSEGVDVSKFKTQRRE